MQKINIIKIKGKTMNLSILRKFLKFDHELGTYEIISDYIKIYKSNPRDKYPMVKIYDKFYQIHRLAWMDFYNINQYKDLPKCIDHIDRNKHNFKITNLRDVTIKENNKNRYNKNDPAKYGKCVYYNEILKQYSVKMAFDGGIKYTKNFDTLTDAQNYVKEKFLEHAYWLVDA